MSELTPFEAFDKIPRLRRDCIITEKLDGTNAQVFVPDDDSPLLFGSRNRWITPEADNFGFARWATEHADGLRKLGPGRHFGEWWGAGVGRRYGLVEKRFSLFNTYRWSAEGVVLPPCVSLVPVLYAGAFCDAAVEAALETLRLEGSRAAPGFFEPEGICVFHVAANQLFKVTLGDDGHKG
jgi:hypothetical protein